MARPALLLISSSNHPQLYGGWRYDGPIFYCYPFVCFSEIEVAPQVKALTEQLAKSLAGRADWVFSPFVYDGQCIDIGTPERYQKAQGILNKIEMENIFEGEAQS
jgi:NDP-sugar pyrophosphorylase family protein